jgi:glutamyl/glutaminyl-tRNA synthetase
VTSTSSDSFNKSYRGRLAPSPTGLLHLGHARTFWIAARRAAELRGTLILRSEDLDSQRCRPEFVGAMYEDLRWLGIEWTEGPDYGGPFGPYAQSERRTWYFEAWEKLRERGLIYPCTCSRKDVAQAAGAPNEGDDEPVYPGTCREKSSLLAKSARSGVLGCEEFPPSRKERDKGGATRQAVERRSTGQPRAAVATCSEMPAEANWRFRVPDGEQISFNDLHLGRQAFVAGRDFGDFIVWRRDDVPAYQLAVVVDDAAMQITEVVRGADLLKSTARQILLFRALGLAIPNYYHCDVVRDEAGIRLAKRHDALSIRKLREMGSTPEQVRGFGH